MSIKQTKGLTNVPIINISSLVCSDPDSASVAHTLGDIKAACRDWGFFYVVGHGIHPELISQFEQTSKDFFKSSKKVKRSVARTKCNFRGFTDNEFTSGNLDWKESFDYTSDKVTLGERDLEIDQNGTNRWPVEFPEFREIMIEFFELMISISNKLMRAIFTSLGLDEEKIFKFFGGTCDTSIARLNYYPECPQIDSHFGVNPHTDDGAITIVLQDDQVTALQVLKDGTYYDLAPVPNSFVVNIGDMVQVWSNEIYKAPIHRVLTNMKQERFSAAFFYNPSNLCNVEPQEACVSETNPAKYRPINFGIFHTHRYYGDIGTITEDHRIKNYRINC